MCRSTAAALAVSGFTFRGVCFGNRPERPIPTRCGRSPAPHHRRTTLGSSPAAPASPDHAVDGVELICVAGFGADQVEDEILWLLVGDASDRSRFLMTTAGANVRSRPIAGVALELRTS